MVCDHRLQHNIPDHTTGATCPDAELLAAPPPHQLTLSGPTTHATQVPEREQHEVRSGPGPSTLNGITTAGIASTPPARAFPSLQHNSTPLSTTTSDKLFTPDESVGPGAELDDIISRWGAVAVHGVSHNSIHDMPVHQQAPAILHALAHSQAARKLHPARTAAHSTTRSPLDVSLHCHHASLTPGPSASPQPFRANQQRHPPHG